MKLCAIVLNYRDAARTEACLRSLAGQGLDIALVVDNSADQHCSNELAEMLARLNAHVDCRLRLLNPGSNLGFARGVNLALGDADALQCDAMLLINNDALALSGMLARLAAALADTDRMMVAPTVVDAAGKPQPILWYQRFFGLLSTRPLPGSFPYLSGCCLLVHRDMLEKGRLFDEDFFMYGEDTLLGWRQVCSGKKTLRLSDAFVRHDGAGSSRRGQLFYEYHMARAHVLLAMKTRRHPLEIPLMLAGKSVVLLLRALWRSLRFKNVVPLRAYFMAWRALDVPVH
jgi:N-acetylglucosaminyl-diphospho-decaprenol L-rhamnosyltransferase